MGFCKLLERWLLSELVEIEEIPLGIWNRLKAKTSKAGELQPSRILVESFMDLRPAKKIKKIRYWGDALQFFFHFMNACCFKMLFLLYQKP